MTIIICGGIFVLSLILIMILSHAPIFKISKNRIEKIKYYGLLHFTSEESAKSIIKTNKLIGNKSSMSLLRNDLVK